MCPPRSQVRRWKAEEKERQKERKTMAPCPLPQKRPRSLTWPLPLPKKADRLSNLFRKPQQTFDQSQSALLSKLPYEIRMLIWTELLSGHLLHINRAHQRLLGISCTEGFGPDLDKRHHSCWLDPTVNYGVRKRATRCLCPREHCPVEPANLLPLLQTCRLVYTETISMLYTDNIFDVNHVDTMIYLNDSLLPHRRNQIRVLNFTWGSTWGMGFCKAPDDRTTWYEACNALANFDGLQELTVHLSGGDFEDASRIYQWESLLEALTAVNASKKFDVLLPWSECECAEAAGNGNYPFRLAPSIKS